MPIVDVEIVVAAHEMLRRTLAADLADALGAALASPPGRTWVRLHMLPRAHYAEHGGTIDDAHPVFITILKSQRPTGMDLENEIRRVTTAVATCAGRAPSSVHVIYEPDALGRIAFGGEIVK